LKFVIGRLRSTKKEANVPVNDRTGRRIDMGIVFITTRTTIDGVRNKKWHEFANIDLYRAITGTNWNGPRFFSLRQGTKKSAKPEPVRP